MNYLHIDEACEQGFTVDNCCNPPIAYKGPRFQPTEIHYCYTHLETKLLKTLVKMADTLDELSKSIHESLPHDQRRS